MQTRPVELPQPEPDSRAQSERMMVHLRARAGGGLLSFAEYLHEVLYAPTLGYYVAGSTKLGAAGDFVTAPEVSPLFGRVVARQVAEVLTAIDDADVLEVGAGSGVLAVDVLRGLQALDRLPRRYRILEVSAELAQRQQRRLRDEVPELASRVVWETDWPTRFRGAVIANELLDALPFERFVCRESGLQQQCVRVTEGGIEWAERAAPGPLLRWVESIETDLDRRLPAGYSSEVAPSVANWIADLAQSIEEGVVLLFDYGVSRREYYAADRDGGWLRCHFRHHAHSNPLILPGIQDVTTWVDFTLAAEAACDAGLTVLGYAPQAQFLLGGGLHEAVADMEALSPSSQLELSAQIKTLTLPGAMGEHFKCLALGRGDMTAPTAFQLADRTHTL